MQPGLWTVLCVLSLATPSFVMASWDPHVVGPASALAATVNAALAPTATVAARTVTVSWSPSTLSNGISVTGYEIRRYDATGDVEQPIVDGSCATIVETTHCSETAVSPGTWRYSVTPVHNNWRGMANLTASVTVEAPSMTLSPTATRTPMTLTGSIANFLDGESIGFRLDGPSGTSLAGTIDGAATPTQVPTGGAAAITVSLPEAVSDGEHTLYAIGSPSSENASVPVTVDNTPPPVPTITAKPAALSDSSSGSFSFTHAEAGATFQCRLDGGTFGACSSPYAYSGLVDGVHGFEVRAQDGVGNVGSATGYTWTVDTTDPTATVTFPIAGSFYNDAGFNAGCGTPSTGDLCGTTADPGSGVTQVRVSIQNGAGSYWNGTGFLSSNEVLLSPTGTTGWSYGFAASGFPADGNYTIRVHATDAAGNTTVTLVTFSVDRTAPTASDVQSANASGGTSRRAEAGDTVTFTYSEPIRPDSILAGWNGSATNVVVRINHGLTLLLVPGPDVLQVWNAGNSAQLPVGQVDLGRTDYVSADVSFGASGTPATMTQSGSTIVVTLGTPSNPAAATTAGGSGTMVWTPSAGALDRAGNACSTTARTESGLADDDL